MQFYELKICQKNVGNLWQFKIIALKLLLLFNILQETPLSWPYAVHELAQIISQNAPLLYIYSMLRSFWKTLFKDFLKTATLLRVLKNKQ